MWKLKGLNKIIKTMIFIVYNTKWIMDKNFKYMIKFNIHVLSHIIIMVQNFIFLMIYMVNIK